MVGAVHSTLTRVEVAAVLAVAQDHAFGQPVGSQLRAAVLGQHLAAVAGVDRAERETVWWVSTLRFLGCTGHAFDTAVLFGDEIELRARSLRNDMSNPMVVLRMMVELAGPGTTGVRRLRSVLSILAGGKKAAEANFRSACEVADVFLDRLGLDSSVRAALAANFERWNGRGLPEGRKGEGIPRPMRVAHLAQEFEVLARLEGVERGCEIVASRSGKAYEPELAGLVVANGPVWWEAVEPVDPWDAALALAPACAPLTPSEIAGVLCLLADFADLKSPWWHGHSRAVADLARQASGEQAEHAALVHDLGCVAVANSIWDKPGPFTRDERDRVETHALVTDQLLRRVPGLAHLAPIAAAAHERLDGSGYHRHSGAGQLDDAQRVVAAADAYQAMISQRAHRPARTPADAAGELRSMSAAGQLDGEAVERVLAAAGHRRAARPPQPAGLTAREVEVLRLVTLGLTTKQIAGRLVISTKTADHHVQHVYTKIGVSTRGAAALYAIEHGILPETP